MLTIITGWISSKFTAILPYLLAIVAAIGGYFGIRQSGKNAAYQEMAKKAATQTQKALDVQQTVNNLSDDDVANKLREFYRKSP